ncbi:hypothetical protein ACJA23_02470 [Mycoplasma corogypsi]|uniref:hypothetical protein n=1 Tax=Mycoplasma corogypsi TaxID=2106 RepID=UPI003872CC25
MKKTKPQTIDPAIFRAVFIRDIEQEVIKRKKNKFLLLRRKTIEQYLSKITKLHAELSSAKIANKDLAANRKLYNKLKSEIVFMGTIWYLLIVCVLILSIIVTLTLKFII